MESVAGRMLRPSTPPSVACGNAVNTDIKPGELAKLFFFSVEVRNASLTSIQTTQIQNFRHFGKKKFFFQNHEMFDEMFENFEIRAAQNCENLVDLEKCCKMIIY